MENSNLLKTGTKFIVNEKTSDSTFGPGTVGYAVALMGYDMEYENAMFLYAMIMRRGKGGKDRIEMTDVSMPIFDIDDKLLADKMPDQKRRKYVFIDPVRFEYKNVFDMPTMDFIGWAASQATFLKMLADKASTPIWPKDNQHVVEKFRHSSSYFEDDPGAFMSWADQAEVKLSFVSEIRTLESALTTCKLVYAHKALEVENKALDFLAKLGIGGLDETRANYGKALSALTKVKKTKQHLWG